MLPNARVDRTESDSVDPIALALTQNRLDHISRQMGWVMIRTSRSPIFNQSHDFSCFITDADGQLVSQADGIPIHTGGGGFAVRAILAAFESRIDDGDVFLLNDPYLAGGNHLPDWVIARPVFVAGRRVAFTCNRAHQSDIGGGAAGTYNPMATEIFHEGIRLPPLKLVHRDQLRDDVWAMLLANTRCPDLLDGDLRAMIGSTGVGARQVSELIGELGIGGAEMYFSAVLDHGDRRMRALLGSAPCGTFRAEDGYDHDCFQPVDARIRVAVTLAEGGATVDFTGTDRQIRGFKNSSLANTYSAVYAAFASFFDEELPRNEGTFRSLRIIAPAGTIVNATPPAALTMCTVFPAHEIIHACWWALGEAMPRRNAAGWGKNCFPVTSGTGTDGRTWVLYHWGGASGAGAVDGRDGFNTMGPLCTLGGLVLPNAETYERLYPVRFLRHEFRCDSGGAGTYRGGTGVSYDVEVCAEAEWSFRGEGTGRSTGLGVAGGLAGAQGTVAAGTLDGEHDEFTPKYAVTRRGPTRLRIDSPGGGGFGDPRLRDPLAVLRDVRDGLVSRAAATAVYGVTIDGKHVADAVPTVARLGETATR